MGESNLQNFVMKEAERQLQTPEGEIESEKLQSFYSDALASIKKMNGEVAKCEEQRRQLHTELGDEHFAVWRQEHGSQVLNKHQQALVEQADKMTLERSPSNESR